MLPKICHVFRLSRDPELRYTTSGTTVCKVGLVASEKRNQDETTLWLDGTAFGKTAEFLNNVRKGQRVFIVGRLQTDQWTDNNGGKRSRTALIIESFEYIEKKEEPQQPYGSGHGYAYTPPPSNPAQGVPVEHQDAQGNVTGRLTVASQTDTPEDAGPDDEDLPF